MVTFPSNTVWTSAQGLHESLSMIHTVCIHQQSCSLTHQEYQTLELNTVIAYTWPTSSNIQGSRDPGWMNTDRPPDKTGLYWKPSWKSSIMSRFQKTTKWWLNVHKDTTGPQCHNHPPPHPKEQPCNAEAKRNTTTGSRLPEKAILVQPSRSHGTL